MNQEVSGELKLAKPMAGKGNQRTAEPRSLIFYQTTVRPGLNMKTGADGVPEPT